MNELILHAGLSEFDSGGTGAQREADGEEHATNKTMSHISGRRMGC